jgi:NAD(P)H dehydrogenase (quinone)
MADGSIGMDLIIFAHPDNKNSHNAAVLRYLIQRLKANGVEFGLIDLYADRFDPVIRLVDFDMPLGDDSARIKEYQGKVRTAERLIFIYPVWFYNMPAMMKGFIERVFTNGFAYEFSLGNDGKAKETPLLAGKKAVVINTFGHGEELARKFGRTAGEVLDKSVFGLCGIKSKRVEWFSVKGAAILPGAIARKIDEALA